jgi:hypothetical protein
MAMNESESVPVDTTSGVEHVCLSSGFEETGSGERVTNLEFDQRDRLRRTRICFTVFNEHYVAVESSRVGKKPLHYEFDLSFLASRPKRIRRMDWLSYGLAALLLSAAAMAALLARPEVTAMTLALTLSAFSLSLGLAIYRSQDKLVFVSKHGRVPLLVLSRRDPQADRLQAFVTDISRRIQATRKKWSGKSEFLSAELRQHRRLQEEGFLTGKEYESVKQRILGRHQ